MKNIAIGAVIFLIAVIVFVAITDKATGAQGGGSDSAIMRKLDDIMAGQKAILQSIEAMRQELNVIKIRITQQQ